MTYYILGDNHRIIPTEDIQVWGEWMQCEERVVQESVREDVRVSTVFLGIDHGFFTTSPLLFETMIFGGERDGEFDRCCTWDEAVAQHKRFTRHFGWSQPLVEEPPKQPVNLKRRIRIRKK